MRNRIAFFILGGLLILSNASAQEPRLLEHGGGVRTVAFSPVDAALLATAGESNIIKLWNLQDNSSVNLIGHTDRVNSVAFSPNGTMLASVSDDRTIMLWDINNQVNITTLRQGTQFQAVAFSSDGQLLATGGWMHVKLWDVRRQEVVETLLHEGQVHGVAFSSDGQFLAVGYGSNDGPGMVKVWDIDKRQGIRTLNGDPKIVRDVEFSADTRYLASSGWGGELQMWAVSDWSLVRTIPSTAYKRIAFSPDGKTLVSTRDGQVNFWWVEDGTRITQLDGGAKIYAVDFSHDGTLFVGGGEDGKVQIWRINTGGGSDEGAVRILHVSGYLEQLPEANTKNSMDIPEPVPPPPIVRDYFQLDPFYEQWVDVEGFPVLASAKVNPYALKEAAWLIRQMIGHRREILQAMVEERARLAVIAHTEIITEIPEYRDEPRPDFLIFRERGWGGSERATISSSEENILSYAGDYGGYSVLIHEFAHGIHLIGLRTADPSFDARLHIAYESAMRKGLWRGTYASSDRREYWAEGTHAWFYPKGGASFSRFGNTRNALKQYDPELAALLTEIYGDNAWQYTSPLTRTDQPHLQGYNPKDAPIYEGWPELASLFQQLLDPNSDGGGEWVNLKSYNPNQLSRLIASQSDKGNRTTIIFVNLRRTDVLVYSVAFDGTEKYSKRINPGTVRYSVPNVNGIKLIKDTNGRNIAVFKASGRPGRALIGIQDGSVLPVSLSHFRAEYTKAGTVLNWITESELDNAGFYIYRSQTKAGEFKVVNSLMIQGAGTTGERSKYTWTDTTAKPNTVYYYRIEDVSYAGERKPLATVRLRGLVSARGKLATTWAALKTQRDQGRRNIASQ